MRTKLKGLIREEAGAALVLTLVLLVVGGLILAPLMSHMGSGHLAGQVHEKRMDELYAADAGVERAFWHITGEEYVPDYFSFAANAKNVTVNIEKNVDGCGTYRVLSKATTDDVSGTTVEAYIAPTSFLDNAITSKNNVELLNANVKGSVVYGGDAEKNKVKNTEIEDGSLTQRTYESWPSLDVLKTYYREQVDHLPAFSQGSIDIADYAATGIPSLFRGNWDDLEEQLNLEIGCSDGNPVVELLGTIYVTGNLDFTQPGGDRYTIDLNGKTIFAEGDITFPSQNIRIIGSGAIIAGGNIEFKPGMNSDPDSFVLVLSTDGMIDFKPSVESSGGTFYGSLVGNASVDMKNASIAWRPRGDRPELNFPIDLYETMVIASWVISTEVAD